MHMKKFAIFSLIFSFIFAAYSSPEEREQVTRRTMENVGSAIEAYISDYGHAPEVTSIKALTQLLVPSYLTETSLKDGWGREFHYTARNTTGKAGAVLPEYWLASGGENGSFEGFLKYILKTGTQDGAMVYSGGSFL